MGLKDLRLTTLYLSEGILFLLWDSNYFCYTRNESVHVREEGNCQQKGHRMWNNGQNFKTYEIFLLPPLTQTFLKNTMIAKVERALACLFVAVIKHWANATWGEKVLFLVYRLVHHWENLRQELQSETNQAMLFTTLLPLLCLATFYIQLRLSA